MPCLQKLVRMPAWSRIKYSHNGTIPRGLGAVLEQPRAARSSSNVPSPPLGCRYIPYYAVLRYRSRRSHGLCRDIE